jgi:hypothetical protein
MHRDPLLSSTGDAQTYNARCADARKIGAVETEGEVGIGLVREDTFVVNVVDEQSGLPAVLLPADLRIEQQIGVLLRDVFRVQCRVADNRGFPWLSKALVDVGGLRFGAGEGNPKILAK